MHRGTFSRYVSTGHLLPEHNETSEVTSASKTTSRRNDERHIHPKRQQQGSAKQRFFKRDRLQSGDEAAPGPGPGGRGVCVQLPWPTWSCERSRAAETEQQRNLTDSTGFLIEAQRSTLQRYVENERGGHYPRNSLLMRR